MRPRGSVRASLSVAAAGAAVSTATAGLVLGARSLLSGQADQARRVIPHAWDVPPRADGVYAGDAPVERYRHGVPSDLHLMVFGDSTATGYGCRDAEEVPGVLMARGLAQRSGLRVRLSTKAIVGATSKGLQGQVDAMFVAGPPPDAAVIMIGANDITRPNGIGASARRLGAAVGRLRDAGAEVVVGTCPDFGLITAIPQPLRAVTRHRGRRLARAQAAAVRAADGVPVPFSDLLPRSFVRTPALLFSDDMFHPSAAGYALAAAQLLPALCRRLDCGDDAPEPPLRAAGTGGLVARLRGLPGLRRPTTGVPAPVLPPT